MDTNLQVTEEHPQARGYILDNWPAALVASRLSYIIGCSFFQLQPSIFMIQGHRMQNEKREGYELQLVMAIAIQEE